MSIGIMRIFFIKYSFVVFYPLKPVISLITSPAIISPTTLGTKAIEPGTVLLLVTSSLSKGFSGCSLE